jgi:ABC-type bacteriocin/lantibiotic exporter with double-glycine peptidase domain
LRIQVIGQPNNLVLLVQVTRLSKYLDLISLCNSTLRQIVLSQLLFRYLFGTLAVMCIVSVLTEICLVVGLPDITMFQLTLLISLGSRIDLSYLTDITMELSAGEVPVNRSKDWITIEF